MGTIPHWIRQGRPPAPRGSQEMQAADPAARKRALLFVVLAALLGAALLAWMAAETDRIEGLFAADPEAATRQATTLFLGVTWAAAGVALLAAIVIFRAAMEIRRTGRYPAPEARLLRDTMVSTGARAERIARVGLVTAALLAIAAPMLVVTAYRLVAAPAGP